MSSAATPYRDGLGHSAPSDRIAGPGHVYLGNLHRGRVAITTTGKRVKVVSQNEGSTTVRVSKPGAVFTRQDGSVGKISASSDELTIARGTIVRPLA